MSNPAIKFYFDFLSPYAYLAQQRLPALAAQAGCDIDYVPVDLAWIKREARNTGPSAREMPLKLTYARADLQRWAGRYGVTLIPLVSYDSSRANKGVFFAIDQGMAAEYVDLLWKRVYGEGADMGSDPLLQSVARTLDWDPKRFLDYTGSAAAQDRLEAANRAAHQQGVFGVPSMVIDDTLWWGNDRLEFLADHLAARREGGGPSPS